MVKEICHLTNSNFEQIVNIKNERLGKDQSYLLDSEKMRKTFNWKDTISLDEGIKDTIEWVEKNYSYFSNIPWNYLHRL